MNARACYLSSLFEAQVNNEIKPQNFSISVLSSNFFLSLISISTSSIYKSCFVTLDSLWNVSSTIVVSGQPFVCVK